MSENQDLLASVKKTESYISDRNLLNEFNALPIASVSDVDLLTMPPEQLNPMLKELEQFIESLRGSGMYGISLKKGDVFFDKLVRISSILRGRSSVVGGPVIVTREFKDDIFRTLDWEMAERDLLEETARGKQKDEIIKSNKRWIVVVNILAAISLAVTIAQRSCQDPVSQKVMEGAHVSDKEKASEPEINSGTVGNNSNDD